MPRVFFFAMEIFVWTILEISKMQGLIFSARFIVYVKSFGNKTSMYVS